MNAGRLSKRNVNVTLTGNLVKQHLGLPLSRDEEELEREFRKTPRAGTPRARTARSLHHRYTRIARTAATNTSTGIVCTPGPQEIRRADSILAASMPIALRT